MILYRKRNYEPKLRALFVFMFFLFAFGVSYLGCGVGVDFINKDVGVMTFFRACLSIYFLRATIHAFFAIFRRQLVLFPTSNEYELFYTIKDAEDD